MGRIYENWDFQETCEEMGGKFEQNQHENDFIHICRVGDRSIVWHDYEDGTPRGENNIFIWSHENGEEQNDWSGHDSNLYTEDREFVLKDAEGNPGPPGPMYVDDATVKFGEYDTRAQQTRHF